MLRTVRVKHREDPMIEEITYTNVIDVVDAFDSNRNFCHRLILEDGSTATYPACEWQLFELKYVLMF